MSESRLRDWAHIAEIISSVVVIVSLIFVGLEIRQNTNAVQSAAAQVVHDNFAGWYSSLQTEPELLEISTRGMRNYDSLSETEKAQFIAMFMAFVFHGQDAYYKWREGSLESKFWRAWENVSMNFFSTSGGRAFWGERSYLFADEFQRYVEDHIMQQPPHPQAKAWGAIDLDRAAD